ncbi:hypothetical protein [Lactobacillus corticis]|uniref:Uncharacterized protein n=1 Tax=Lactobacillus corticis TaxID=2201249 RepID=A0A916QI56_9LACO|nr:hypothetical protein [Lactobacillus corticis]GFZ26467.1 hypothetical protein LCB40_03470 [Lactobacillus corticis]
MKICKYVLRGLLTIAILFLLIVMGLNLSDYINSAKEMGWNDFVPTIIGHVIGIVMLLVELYLTYSSHTLITKTFLAMFSAFILLIAVGFFSQIAFGGGVLVQNLLVLIFLLLLAEVNQRLA